MGPAGVHHGKNRVSIEGTISIIVPGMPLAFIDDLVAAATREDSAERDAVAHIASLGAQVASGAIPRAGGGPRSPALVLSILVRPIRRFSGFPSHGGPPPRAKFGLGRRCEYPTTRLKASRTRGRGARPASVFLAPLIRPSYFSAAILAENLRQAAMERFRFSSMSPGT
jgi:hypothetical protein